MSVFTFDHDPPRVASPWLIASDSMLRHVSSESSGVSHAEQTGLLSDYGLTKLDAEPQEGPTEYKLHLLLRPRRIYLHMSTSKQYPMPARDAKTLQHPAWLPASSNQSRQERILSLTTQLLWRLQQSAPYHAKISGNSIAPRLLSEDVSCVIPGKMGNLVPGIEDSRGALYEIGVADDGTLVGLAKDEMDESLATLRQMAASLGCTVEVLRMVVVGECSWLESTSTAELNTPANGISRDQLWVAEALVAPDLSSRPASTGASRVDGAPAETVTTPPMLGALSQDQLRVTLTGPSTTGKSTLLGSLSTGVLDNGRGASRMNLFNHQHERASGVTSSVSQELIGYKGGEIHSYADHQRIESWENIHDLTQDGRLAFVSDCAGHPRYRRTIMRGLIGWAPHWTLLCLTTPDLSRSPALGPTSPPQDFLGAAAEDVDLSMTYLNLCLRLEMPLVIVVTKFDLITKTALNLLLQKVFSAIHGFGRGPKLFLDQTPRTNISAIPPTNDENIKAMASGMVQTGDFLSVVPIVLTSAVKGIGIGLVHSLLKNLPRPPRPTPYDFTGEVLNPEQPMCLFHIDDRFSLPASYGAITSASEQSIDLGTVLAGYVRFGKLAVGDNVLLGPFSSVEDDCKGATSDDRASPSPGVGLSASHPLSSVELSRFAMRNAAVPASKISGEWHSATIVSIRNLRLPVQTLDAGQVGTVGIVLDATGDADATDSLFEHTPPSISKIRKGMVLAVPSKHMISSGLSLQAASGLTVHTRDPTAGQLVAGNHVNVYVATIRASARITSVSRARLAEGSPTAEIDEMFNMNEQGGSQTPHQVMDIHLELLSHREWIELGSQILILEGGRNDRTGLAGIVGKVVEIVD
jgi:GTPase